MSEPTSEATGAGTDEAVEDQGTEESPGEGAGGRPEEADPAAELAHWKAMARKHETRARENSKAAKELADLKAASMTDLERSQAELTEARRERDEARADHARIMAAATHDLPVELIDYLGTGTDEEINDRAEAIAGAVEARAREIADEILAQASGSRNGSMGARPVESMRAGSQPSSGGTPQTSEEWFRSLVNRE